MKKYMEIAIKQAKTAKKHQEVPVGAVIVYKNKIIAKAYNKKESKKNVIKHAEILAIDKACKKLHNWRLIDCELYVTVEPCLMCYGAIEQSKIKKTVYGVKNLQFGFLSKYNIEDSNIIQVDDSKIMNECKKIIKTFFQQKRK